eukprot:jgi/Ulvmu1/9417/UM051_0045.1
MQCQIQCQGCQITLMYPQGAANVRCSQCQHITPVAAAAPAAMRTPPAGMPPQMTQQLPSAQRAQLQCAGCQVMLMYPRGANNVQCAVCGVVSSAAQANTVAHLQCSSCQTWLMYSFGARSVKCAVCESVNSVLPAAMPGPALLPPAMPAGPPPASAAQAPMASAGPPASPGGPGGAAIGPAEAPPVVVQNPSSIDEKGNEVKEVMLGYKDTGS